MIGRRVQQTGRIIALLMAFLLVAASCGDSDTSDGSDDADASTETTASETSDDDSDDASTETTAGETSDDDSDDASTDDSASELATAPGFDGETISVGVLSAMSGPTAVIGVPLAAGQQVYFDYLNAELGGVAGQYPVEIVLEDHLYDTATTVQKYGKIKDDIIMFSQIMGTPSTFATLPLLAEDNMVASPASQDAFWVREQNLFPVIEPYQIDVINAMDYYLGDGGGSVDDTICAVIQNDLYGEAGLQGLEFAAEYMGFEIATVTRYGAGDQDFTAQVTELVNTECNMVWGTALPTELGGILGTAAQSGFTPRWIVQSPAWIDALALTPLKDYLQAYVWVAALGQEWGDPNSTEMTAMVERVAKYKPDQAPSYYFTFGYIQAWATHQLLENAVENGDMSRQGIIDAMNGLAELDYGDLGAAYTYGAPNDRNPSRSTTIFAIDAEKPFALAALAPDVTSEGAKAFEFPEAG
ncbi:MAG: ABC transporter substrate-binding protein [Actinomycetia bacterium]|nr:ABC transporter substrate-binding protein [Actinomycetes bacterium]